MPVADPPRPDGASSNPRIAVTPSLGSLDITRLASRKPEFVDHAILRRTTRTPAMAALGMRKGNAKAG